MIKHQDAFFAATASAGSETSIESKLTTGDGRHQKDESCTFTVLCRSGVKPSGFCNDQVCPPQHKCEIGSNLCCPVFDSFSMIFHAHFSLPHLDKGLTAAKPGDSCIIKYDCSGARFRLATCHYGVCICLAPAKPFRNTCIIPKKSKCNKTKFGDSKLEHWTDNVLGILQTLTTPQPMLDLDTFFQNEALNLSTTIKILPLKTHNCTNDTNCDAQLKQKCLFGQCVSPKRLGENCTSGSQCSLHCLSSTCKQLKSLPYKTCQCEQKLYLYKNTCVKKCPKGTNTKEGEFSCDDSPFSRSIRDTEAFHKDLKTKNAC
uniref:EB domain-containing protein n=1 Tax=Romanomermis culicivorax TaxID=13658 RepID=A0A915HQJ9_ROMCU